MTKDELITRCTLKLGTLSRDKVNIAIDSILELMTMTLVNRSHIEIRGFGSFHNKVHKAKVARHPKTGEPCQVAEKLKPHFKPGKELKERVNNA